MKIKAIFSAMLLCFFIASVIAQKPIPAGYTKATINLANGTVVQGYVKENLKKKSVVDYIDNAGNNKKRYDGGDINSLSSADGNFICINGDFFKIICAGKLNFLQKSTNSSNKIFYNGTEPMLNNGTDGRMGDHFIYANNELRLLNRKNVETFINTQLNGYANAIQKTSALNGDVAKLESAVVSYNIHNK